MLQIIVLFIFDLFIQVSQGEFTVDYTLSPRCANQLVMIESAFMHLYDTPTGQSTYSMLSVFEQSLNIFFTVYDAVHNDSDCSYEWAPLFPHVIEFIKGPIAEMSYDVVKRLPVDKRNSFIQNLTISFLQAELAKFTPLIATTKMESRPIGNSQSSVHFLFPCFYLLSRI